MWYVLHTHLERQLLCIDENDLHRLECVLSVYEWCTTHTSRMCSLCMCRAVYYTHILERQLFQRHESCLLSTWHTWAMSLIHMAYVSHVSYTHDIHESCLLYIWHTWVMSLIHMTYMSHVSYTHDIHESCLLHTWHTWVMSLIHMTYMSHVSYTHDIHESYKKTFLSQDKQPSISRRRF
jgi:hypothetical protein